MKTDFEVKHELLLEMRDLLNRAERKGLKFYLLTFFEGNELLPIDMSDIGIRKIEDWKI